MVGMGVKIDSWQYENMHAYTQGKNVFITEEAHNCRAYEGGGVVYSNEC